MRAPAVTRVGGATALAAIAGHKGTDVPTEATEVNLAQRRPVSDSTQVGRDDRALWGVSHEGGHLQRFGPLAAKGRRLSREAPPRKSILAVSSCQAVTRG